jgi:hypothetical protein
MKEMKLQEERQAWARPMSACASPTNTRGTDTDEPMNKYQAKIEFNRKRREMYAEAGKYMRQRVAEKMQLKAKTLHLTLEPDNLQHCSKDLAHLQTLIDRNSLAQLTVIHDNQEFEIKRMSRDLKLSFPQTNKSLRRLSVSACPSERPAVVSPLRLLQPHHLQSSEYTGEARRKSGGPNMKFPPQELRTKSSSIEDGFDLGEDYLHDRHLVDSNKQRMKFAMFTAS